MPDRAIDAQGLIALADPVVSAEGTMNRGAVAPGTPVYSTYGGRLGAAGSAASSSTAAAAGAHR